jgi:hypothetical protein
MDRVGGFTSDSVTDTTNNDACRISAGHAPTITDLRECSYARAGNGRQRALTNGGDPDSHISGSGSN